MATNPVTPTPPSPPVSPNAPAQNNQDATAQALFILGLLGLYATRYSALEAEYNQNHDPNVKAEMDSILSQFNTFRSYYSVNGDTVTFSYNEGAESVELNDPTLLALVQSMPTDIDQFNTFWTTPTNPPVISIIQWMSTQQFNFATASETTQGMALILMLSTESNPVANLAGIGSEFLDSTRLFSNGLIAAEALGAFLSNDKVINAADLIDALNIPNAGQAYQQFYSTLSSNYQSWLLNPPVSESTILTYEARYWPQYNGTQGGGETIHAAPLSSTHSPIQNNDVNNNNDPTDITDLYKIKNRGSKCLQ